MPQIECSRCQRTADGLPGPPLPGQAGALVAERTCAECWKEWLAVQVILINELSLSPVNPEHYDKLVVEMRAFLSLD